MIKLNKEINKQGGSYGATKDRNEKENRTLNISNSFITNFNIRSDIKEGKEFFIIPIIALVEGVHHGSGGKGFYPAVEIDRTAQNWNGVPLTIDHPKDNNGSSITANNPEALKQYAVGTFENVRYEKGKLKGEGWIEKNRINLISPKTLEIIQAGLSLEVSTGLFSDGDGEEGIWGGEKFDETLSDFIPDHLALLPEAEGACSFKDGCGVRMNKKKGGEENVKEKTWAVSGNESTETVLRTLKYAGYWVNEISHSKVREQLFKLVSDMDKPGTMHFLREVFDNHFIFEKIVENDSKLFSLDYKINKEDEIKIKGDSSEVKEKIDFISVNNLDGGNDMRTKELIDSIISNKHLPIFNEESRKELEEMEDGKFDFQVELSERLLNCKDCNDEEDTLAKTITANAELVKEVTELKEQLKVNEENKKSEEGEEKEVTLETILANAKPEDRDAWNRMKATEKAEKDVAVKTLVDNKDNKFTEEYLNTQPIDILQNMISLSAVKDYSGQGTRVVQKEVDLNEKQKDGSGVPVMGEVDWNKAAGKKE